MLLQKYANSAGPIIYQNQLTKNQQQLNLIREVINKDLILKHQKPSLIYFA